MNTRSLHDGWTVRPSDGPAPAEVIASTPVPATVPGVVHTDLLAAGLLADPFVGRESLAQSWIGSTSWLYRTAFDWAPDADSRTDLAFDGLDTVAVVRLNGTEILRTENQHRRYRAAVRDLLREGPNELEVRFAAPVPEIDRRAQELGTRPHSYPHPFNALRKMACSFGWDWGPDTATSGIWRPVRLESWSSARIAATRLTATVDEDGTGILTARIDTERDDASDVSIEIAVDGVIARVPLDAAGGADITLRVPDVQRWWPAGHGAPTLYAASIRLLGSDGQLLDGAERRVGFRTVAVESESDATGTAFRIVVNGRFIPIKGYNWIPDDAFPSRITRDRLADRFDEAIASNTNLLRVWGGGIYESDDFYELADQRGLMVWQDFAFACAAYSESPQLWDEVEAEARDNIERIGWHPALVLLNGCNENLWGIEEWGWLAELDGKTWGERYYHELFPRLVTELAPLTPYVPGSPFSPGAGIAANDPAHGTAHIWDIWNDRDWVHYRDHRPRFASEFGWQGPPAFATLETWMPDEPLTPESPSMQAHQGAENGSTKLTRGLLPHLELPENTSDWHWAMSLNQAWAVRAGLEWFRSLQPSCAGTILWQLNDTWPAVSWSVIDSDARRKPAWYAVQRAYAPRLLTIQPDDGRLVLVAVNDTDDPWVQHVDVSRSAFDGDPLTTERVALTVDPHAVVRVPLAASIITPGDPAAEFIHADAAGERAFWYFAEPRDSALPVAEYTATAEAADGGVRVTVRAHTHLRDLAVLADKVDPAARADRMLIDLLPGEEVTILIATASSGPPERFLAAGVLRTVNELVSSAPRARNLSRPQVARP